MKQTSKVLELNTYTYLVQLHIKMIPVRSSRVCVCVCVYIAIVEIASQSEDCQNHQINNFRLFTNLVYFYR